MGIGSRLIASLAVFVAFALAPVVSAEDPAPTPADATGSTDRIPPFCVTLKCPPDACGAPSTDCGNAVATMWDDHFANCGAPPDPLARMERMCGEPMPANATIDYYAPSVRWLCCRRSPFGKVPTGE